MRPKLTRSSGWPETFAMDSAEVVAFPRVHFSSARRACHSSGFSCFMSEAAMSVADSDWFACESLRPLRSS